jgi:NADPH-dependent curcumin reductase CurA
VLTLTLVACGMISQYNLEQPYGIKNLMMVVSKRLLIRGFIVGDPDFGPKHAKAHQEHVAKWIADGSFKTLESITDGMDNAVDGFLGMLKGDNFGKAVLQIHDPKEL